MPRWSSGRRAVSIAKLIFEPGRLIVGNAGILVTRILYLKRGEAKAFVIVDAGMNDLIRPTLYEAITRSSRCSSVSSAPHLTADVVGRCANRAISWRWVEILRKPGRAICSRSMTAGAYGAVQAGTYNTRPLIPEVLVRDGEWALVRAPP